VRTVCRTQIGADLLCLAAGCADLGNDSVGFLLATAVVNQDLCALSGECEGAGAADATRSAGDEGGFPVRLVMVNLQ
jgi:hypothetical protein